MSSMMHRWKLQFFCRICAESTLDKNIKYPKDSLKDVVLEYYNAGFAEDTEFDHPSKICDSCYKKLLRWKEKKKKFDKNKKRNEEKGITFNDRAPLPESLETGTLPCSSDGTCKVCKLEIVDPNENTEPSPAKYQKLSEQPTISPSDVQKKSEVSKSKVVGKARKSILVEKSESVLQTEGETETVKIYVSENVFDVNQCVDSDVALLFVCSICSNVPKDPYKIIGCQHIVCLQCVMNYKTQTKSSKCPFQNCRQVYNSTQIVPLDGRDRSVFNSLRMDCANQSCRYQCSILQIEEHASSCRKRGSYKNTGLRGKKSNFTEEKIKDLKKVLDQTCQEGKLDTTDILFFLLRDNHFQFRNFSKRHLF